VKIHCFSVSNIGHGLIDLAGGRTFRPANTCHARDQSWLQVTEVREERDVARATVSYTALSDTTPASCRQPQWWATN